MILFGFTTIDQESYRLVFDTTREHPEQIFKKVENYVLSKGFILEQKIAESIPEEKLVSQYKMGTPYQGGVFLTVTLKNKEIILIDGARLRGGCSKQERIKEVNKLRDNLLVYLNESSSSDFKLESE
jgi:hypothetical protein